MISRKIGDKFGTEENTNEISYNVVVLNNTTKYSPLAFGNAFTNIQYMLDEKDYRTKRNLTEYFKTYGPIIDHDGNQFVYKDVSTLEIKGKLHYTLNFENLTR